MKKLFFISALFFASIAADAQCPNYVLSANQNWDQQTSIISRDTIRNNSTVKLSIFVHIENAPVGLFEVKRDTVYQVNTVDWTETLRYSPKYAEVLLQAQIAKWRKK